MIAPRPLWLALGARAWRSASPGSLAVAAALFCLASFVVHSHGHLAAADAGRVAPSCAWAMGPEGRRRAALSYRALAADVYYLRAINAFGSTAQHRLGYPTVSPLLWAASELDPYFVGPYLLGGTALTVIPGHADDALALLARGVEHRADQWRLTWLYGFELYQRRRFGEAALQVGQAAQHAEAPPFLASLAARLAAAGHRPEVGLLFLDALLATERDADTRALLKERRDALEWQQGFERWQAAIDDYAGRHRRPPPSLEAVRAEAERQRLPPLPARDPWGAPFALEGGKLYNEHASRRLEVHPAPAPQQERP